MYYKTERKEEKKFPFFLQFSHQTKEKLLFKTSRHTLHQKHAFASNLGHIIFAASLSLSFSFIDLTSPFQWMPLFFFILYCCLKKKKGEKLRIPRVKNCPPFSVPLIMEKSRAKRHDPLKRHGSFFRESSNFSAEAIIWKRSEIPLPHQFRSSSSSEENNVLILGPYVSK